MKYSEIHDFHSQSISVQMLLSPCSPTPRCRFFCCGRCVTGPSIDFWYNLCAWSGSQGARQCHVFSIFYFSFLNFIFYFLYLWLFFYLILSLYFGNLVANLSVSGHLWGFSSWSHQHCSLWFATVPGLSQDCPSCSSFVAWSQVDVSVSTCLLVWPRLLLSSPVLRFVLLRFWTFVASWPLSFANPDWSGAGLSLFLKSLEHIVDIVDMWVFLFLHCPDYNFTFSSRLKAHTLVRIHAPSQHQLSSS